MRLLKLLSAVTAGFGVLVGIVPDCNGAVCKGYLSLQAEIPTIRKAALRNSIKFDSDDWFLLLAIRKQENGRSGCEFGVKHPKAWDTNLDTQAGWASATIVKHHERFGSDKVTPEFIDSLGNRYCPKEVDPIGNKNWKRNVKYWFEKFRLNSV